MFNLRGLHYNGNWKIVVTYCGCIIISLLSMDTIETKFQHMVNSKKNCHIFNLWGKLLNY